MSDEDRLGAKHQEHRAEMAEKFAALEVRVIERIHGSVGIAGVLGVAAFIGAAWFLLDRITGEVERRITTESIDNLIEERLRAPQEELRVRVSRLDEREAIAVLTDRVIADDDARAYDDLVEIKFEDENLRRAARAAVEQIGAHLVLVIGSSGEVEIGKRRAKRDHKSSNDELLAELDRVDSHRWDRGAAAWILADDVSFSHEPLEQNEPLLAAVLKAMRSDKSLAVRGFAYWKFATALQLEQEGYPPSRAKIDRLERRARAKLAIPYPQRFQRDR